MIDICCSPLTKRVYFRDPQITCLQYVCYIYCRNKLYNNRLQILGCGGLTRLKNIWKRIFLSVLNLKMSASHFNVHEQKWDFRKWWCKLVRMLFRLTVTRQRKQTATQLSPRFDSDVAKSWLLHGRTWRHLFPVERHSLRTSETSTNENRNTKICHVKSAKLFQLW